mmetsp:Transcript_5721/g.12644  ORF Transcript_5721/g.12644 Transcript_5721/m.12644 type:complete len:96 (-) Transcript_5721:2394-2681(-)
MKACKLKGIILTHGMLASPSYLPIILMQTAQDARSTYSSCCACMASCNVTSCNNAYEPIPPLTFPARSRQALISPSPWSLVLNLHCTALLPHGMS